MKPEGDPPLCKCHGEPMGWHTNARRKQGGFWSCAVKNREYGKSETGRAARERYEKSEAGRAARERYEKSAPGRAIRERYDSQPHRKLQKQLYNLTRVRVNY